MIVSVEPASGRYDEGSDAWLGQVAALRRELRAAVGVGAVVPLSLEPTPAVTKGAWQPIGVSVTTARTLAALVGAAEAWLGRERSRSLRFSWTASDGSVRSMELTSGDADNDDWFEALRNDVAATDE